MAGKGAYSVQAGNLVGRELDGMILQERIGRSGVATRYRAFLPENTQALTVYVYNIPFRESDRRDVFERETARLKKLEHPHIRQVRRAGISGDFAFVAYDLVRGGTLAEMLEKTGVLPFDTTLKLFSQICDALSYAHARGIHHHDLKPGTIILDDAGDTYLMSFGLGRRIFGDDVTGSRENIMLRAAHNPPELMRGETADLRADIYSLGSILYRAVTGADPFQSGGSAAEIIQRQLNEPPTPPSRLNSEVSALLETVIMTALRKAPSARYSSVDAFKSAFVEATQRLIEGKDIRRTDDGSIRAVEIDPEPQIDPVEPTSSISGRTIAAVIAGTALFVLVGLVVIALNASTSAPGEILPGETGTAATVLPALETLRSARLQLGTTGTVAYIACNRTSEFHATRAREISELADEYQIHLHIYDSDSDPTREVANIQAAITDDAQAIIICVLNPETAMPGLQQAQEAGVFLVMDTTELQGQIDGVFVYTSNYDIGYAAGRAAGAYADRNVFQPRAVILDFPDLETIVQRADGLEDGFLDAAPDAEVVGRWLGATQVNGEASLAALLEEEVDFNVILSINDAGAYGAIEELDRAGISPDDVHIFSVDAEQIARNYIDDGYYMRGSLTVGREAGSTAMVNAAVSLLGGQDVPQNIEAQPGALYPMELDASDAG